jgi:hypothetical protein
MSWKKLKLCLTGASPLICHNAQLSNPLNYYAKEIKKISGKRKKTDADLERMAELEFKGGLYCDENERPILPAEGIEAIVVAGAKKSKEGPTAKAGVICSKHFLLTYDGPEKADDLWADKDFVLQASVRVNNSRIIRTRPIFRDWKCDVELEYNTEMCNEEQVIGWLKTTGEQCGSFDWRPKYGRFIVEKIE